MSAVSTGLTSTPADQFVNFLVHPDFQLIPLQTCLKAFVRQVHENRRELLCLLKVAKTRDLPGF